MQRRWFLRVAMRKLEWLWAYNKMDRQKMSLESDLSCTQISYFKRWQHKLESFFIFVYPLWQVYSTCEPKTKSCPTVRRKSPNWASPGWPHDLAAIIQHRHSMWANEGLDAFFVIGCPAAACMQKKTKENKRKQKKKTQNNFAYCYQRCGNPIMAHLSILQWYVLTVFVITGWLCCSW